MEKCIYECFALRGANEALFQSNKSRQINPNMSRQIQTASVTTRFKRINSDSSIPTSACEAWKVWYNVGFNRINPNRSIPTIRKHIASAGQGEVSIVSIQTDQSRRLRITRKVAVAFAFQSYQSKQINPDPVLDALRDKKLGKFQSYQSRQINPDKDILTDALCGFQKFQSYQSKQINPDDEQKYREALDFIKFQSYQSKQINPDVVIQRVDGTFETMFQSYQSRQINPDLDRSLMASSLTRPFQSYQSKQSNPDF